MPFIFELFTRASDDEAYARSSMETQRKRAMASGKNKRTPNLRLAVLLLIFCGASASAQTQPSPLDLRLPRPPDAGAQVGTTPDEYAADTATSVHGSVTSGIGYSKAYGNSTVNAAEVDVNKQFDNGRALNLHIDVLRSTGLPGPLPRDYVSRYPGY